MSRRPVRISVVDEGHISAVVVEFVVPFKLMTADSLLDSFRVANDQLQEDVRRVLSDMHRSPRSISVFEVLYGHDSLQWFEIFEDGVQVCFTQHSGESDCRDVINILKATFSQVAKEGQLKPLVFREEIRLLIPPRANTQLVTTH